MFTKKLLVVDPAVLEDFRPDQKKRGKRKRDFAYSGACVAAEMKLHAAELMDMSGQPVAIAAAAPGNGDYPVYALVRNGRIVRLVIVFDEDPCRERPPATKKRTKKRRRGS